MLTNNLTKLEKSITNRHHPKYTQVLNNLTLNSTNITLLMLSIKCDKCYIKLLHSDLNIILVKVLYFYNHFHCVTARYSVLDGRDP